MPLTIEFSEGEGNLIEGLIVDAVDPNIVFDLKFDYRNNICEIICDLF